MVSIFSILSIDLHPSVQAALIAAFISLVGLMVNIYSNRKIQRDIEKYKSNLSYEIQRDLENLKSDLASKSQRDLEKFKSDLASQNKNIEEKKKSLNNFIGSIQELKDILSMIIDDEFEGFDTDTAKKKLATANESLVKCYQLNQTYLVESERSKIHDVKNQSMRITEATNVLFNDKCYMSELSAVEKNELRDFRDKLGECQVLLRDSSSIL
jgi:septal ring factor EnvC (AmiA/AmiB activator)